MYDECMTSLMFVVYEQRASADRLLPAEPVERRTQCQQPSWHARRDCEELRRAHTRYLVGISYVHDAAQFQGAQPTHCFTTWST